MMYDSILIGAGPAACAAALTLRMRGKSVLMLYAGGGALEKAHRVDNYPGMPQMSGPEMLKILHAQVKEAGAEMKKTVVQLVQPGKKKITVLAGNEIFTCKTLLVSTGVPRKIGLPGEAELLGQGVSYCATCDGMFYKGKQVAVIGSFHEAVEDANFLAGIAERVDYYPEQWHETGALLKNIRMKEQKVLALEREENKILICTGEESVAYDGVFVLRPAVALGQLIPKMETENGRIITDADGRTSLPRIYAAGDAAGAPYQMAKAAGEGNRAALAMAKEMDAMEQGGTE